MIAKGEIQKINLDNTCVVHIPIFDSVGSGEKAMVTATYAIVPGIYNNYQSGDKVYVAFENNNIDTPVVIGKLFVTATAEQTMSRGAANITDLTATGTVKLPNSTTIGNLSFAALNNLSTAINLVSDNLTTGIKNLGQFSLEEQEIGKWIDSKILYKKTIELKYSPIIETGGNINSEIDLASLNYNSIWVDLANSFQIGTQFIVSQYSLKKQDDYWYTYIDLNTKKLYIRGTAPGGGVTEHIITLNYTKK